MNKSMAGEDNDSYEATSETEYLSRKQERRNIVKQSVDELERSANASLKTVGDERLEEGIRKEQNRERNQGGQFK